MKSYLVKVMKKFNPSESFQRFKNPCGITLVELTVSLSVSGIMMAALGYSYEGWISKCRIESTTKEIYSDLMDARVRAMQRNRAHFVALSNIRYAVFEDNHPSPDGDRVLDIAEDKRVVQKDLDVRYPMGWSGVADTKITFTPRGLSNDKKTICLFSDSDPDYDCLEISTTRINMGKIMKQPSEGGTCISSNCTSR